MSFIVKGFDIPKDAVYFKLSFYDGNRENEYGVSGSLKPYIIQIPKGHGRLIDADKLRKEFSRTESGYCGYWEFCDKPEDVQFLIDDEPTILEAEE